MHIFIDNTQLNKVLKALEDLLNEQKLSDNYLKMLLSKVISIEEDTSEIINILNPPIINLAVKFSKGVLNMPNLAEVVGVNDTATIVATSTDKGVVTTVTYSVVSDNPGVLNVGAQAADGTFPLTPVTAGSCNLNFSGTDSGGEVVNPISYVVTVSAAPGTIGLTVTFSKGVVS